MRWYLQTLTVKMHQFSDSDSTDSEDGLRFKTDSTRNKESNKRNHNVQRKSRNHRRRRSRSKSRDKHKSSSRRHRSRSPVDRHSRRSGDSHRKSRNSDVVKERKKAHCDHTPQAKHKAVEEDDDKILGPALPPHLVNNPSNNDIMPEQNIPLKENPVTESTGPSVSSNSHSSSLSNGCNDSLNEVRISPVSPSIGSSLPPQISEESSPVAETIGPSLPPNVKEEAKLDLSDCNESSPRSSSSQNISTAADKSIGPTLPPHLRQLLAEAAEADNEEDIDDSYGPLPADMMASSSAHVALEERALQMKLDKLQPKDEKIVREEWMLELPEVRTGNLGLGPRQFRAKAGPDMSDRSSWTDTPQDKAQKKDAKEVSVDIKQEAELVQIQKRDKEQEEMARKHKKKKRDKSLLEQHQDKINKKKQKEKDEGANERRPFNRDIDLKVNQFDEAQKKAIFKKAQLLDDRFSSGKSKYL